MAIDPLTKSLPSDPKLPAKDGSKPNAKEEMKEDSFRFGDKGDFWTKYCEIADKFDDDRLEKMNTNLGDLLIFVGYSGCLCRFSPDHLTIPLQAGLFSVVNSAFIVLTLGSLIPDPADETNQLLRVIATHFDNSTLSGQDDSSRLALRPRLVRQNCLFFASLASSLLAATGAVLAKQWIESYKHTGQKGPQYEQGRLRTEKFFGSEYWKFRPVVEALPTALLISLALFFVALCDYLWSIDRHVAITVTSFASAGAALYLFTVIVAAVFTRAPFQTALSGSIRRLVLRAKPKHFSPRRLSPYPRQRSYWVSWSVSSPRSTSPHYSTAIRFAANRSFRTIIWIRYRRSARQNRTMTWCQLVRRCG